MATVIIHLLAAREILSMSRLARRDYGKRRLELTLVGGHPPGHVVEPVTITTTTWEWPTG
jgi:hypothetical protein